MTAVRALQTILLINPVAQLGGAERSLIDLIGSARAAEPRLKFHVLLFAEGPLKSALERLGATVSVVWLPPELHSLGESALLVGHPFRRGARLLLTLVGQMPAAAIFVMALRKEIRRHAPDIVHTNGMKAHLLSGLATPAGIPIVWHIQDFVGERPLGRHLLKFAASRVNAVVAISKAVAEDVRKLLPATRIVTILHAVDTHRFTLGPGDGSSLDRLANIPAPPRNTIRIGLVATYARWKGQDVLLQAFAKLRKSLPDQPLRLYLVGGPIYATDASQFTVEELKVMIGELQLEQAVGLIPFQDNIVPILRSLDIVVHASRRPEPFGLSILEAMACGRPVVAAAGGGVSEILQDQVTAMTHAPGDVDGLVWALRKLVESEGLRNRIAAAASRAARTHFSSGRLGPSLVDLYRSVL